jgi:hypothetical protein
MSENFAQSGHPAGRSVSTKAESAKNLPKLLCTKSRYAGKAPVEVIWQRV